VICSEIVEDRLAEIDSPVIGMPYHVNALGASDPLGIAAAGFGSTAYQSETSEEEP
jgi:hypothetical protein